MNNTTINVKKGILFLSELVQELPTHCILNKGITGCGATTVEIRSKRNSIILVPTTALVSNKMEQENIFGVYGAIKNKEIEEYINSTEIKKIIATYNALPRLIEVIGENIFSEYFLLIDEYHIFFNAYSYRRDEIRYVLQNYNRFNKFCFMTATPLKGNKLLKELEHLPIITYN